MLEQTFGPRGGWAEDPRAITVAVESIPLVRAAFESLVATVPGIRLASAGPDHQATTPMVVLEVDVGQGRSSDDGTRAPAPRANVLRLAPHWEPRDALRAVQDGAVGCLTTGASLADLATAIRRVARGEVTMPPGVDGAAQWGQPIGR